MENTYLVSIDAAALADKIERTVVHGSFSGERIDQYELNTQAGRCIVQVFEKYYYRVKNRLMLTVVIDDFTEHTRLHCVSGGGGQGVLFKFDWGAAKSFASVIEEAIAPYRI